jgi:LysM repeat protein
MADIIKQDRADARKAAEAKLAPGETLGDDGGDIPRFETSVDVVGQAPVVPLVGPGIITTLPGPVAEVTTSEEYHVGIGPRESTPGANYSVIPGDTLSGIGQRFTTKVTMLRSLNPQLVGDQIYVGQRLFVPGGDVKLTPVVTTDESFAIDTAAVDAATHAQQLKNAHVFITTMQSRIKAWRGENSLGADFYVYVRELDDEVVRLQHLTDANASTDTLRSMILSINTRAQGVQRLYDVRRGTKDFLINAGIVVLPVVKDGCGIIISALATPAAAAGYAAVISSIESYFAGDGLGVGALKAAGAAFCESFPLMGTKGVNEVQKFLRSSVNQAFSNSSSAVADYFKELKSKKDMTNKEKRALQGKLAARIGVSIATSPLKGALESLGIEVKVSDAATKDLEYKLMNVMSEVLDKAVELTLGPG